MRKLNLIYAFILPLLFSCQTKTNEKIDRFALVERNSPVIHEFDKYSSLSVGNGNFAMTVDATGLQSFPEIYSKGVPLGTQSQWGWHKFSNPEKFRFEETLRKYNFRGKDEWYADQFKEDNRRNDAANYYRENPHRLHLGYVGLEMTDAEGIAIDSGSIHDVDQKLELWSGTITSHFVAAIDTVSVKTVCHPVKDMIATEISSPLISKKQLSLRLTFPYPTGKHCDDATNWETPEKHSTKIIGQGDDFCILERTLDTTVYYVSLQWKGKASITEKEKHYFLISPETDSFAFTCEFSMKVPEKTKFMAEDVFSGSADYWKDFWSKGGVIDFSKCTDERAPELERRIVLSQYLMAIQSAGIYPPQETGLTYNSWFGKFHLEMHWWHAAHFALWNHIDLLERSMDWYEKDAYPVAKEIAERQQFDGVRWMKMTDPSAREAPSKVGSFLIWQQPHYIYFAELIYRQKPTQETLDKYAFLVEETAKFIADFADYDSINDRYILQGIIPAQETHNASETVNPPYEVAYWQFALQVAQQWQERTGKGRVALWDTIIHKLSPLTAKDSLYLAAENATDTYEDIRYTSDHPAVLAALGILPESELTNPKIMSNTLHWIWDNWNWDETWGWDYPMTAMCAARLNEPEKAVGALLMDKRTNTYLPNGHNYQDDRLRVYLPGNGGLLTAVAMMCAGWDGCTTETPGFPKDGTWDVEWEDLQPMP